jgi:hypothetical protein
VSNHQVVAQGDVISSVAVPLRPDAAALADHYGLIVDVVGMCSLATASTRPSSTTARSPVCIWAGGPTKRSCRLTAQAQAALKLNRLCNSDADPPAVDYLILRR